MRAIRPISELGNRVPEAGKIRLGIKVKTAKGREAPKAIDTFRFTSPHEDCIQLLADRYGGTPQAWSDQRAAVQGQWEVITEAKTIDVYVPPGGLTQHYELWAGSGCARRCDGLVCDVPSKGPDGGTMEVPCLCAQNQQMECAPQTRLSLVLSEIPFRGTWTLSSKSWNAAEELVGMERMIDSIQQTVDIVKAQLHLEQRSRNTAQGKRNFVVPVLTLPTTMEALAAGGGGVTAPALAKVSEARAALGAGALPDATDHDDFVHVPDGDDEITDAELVFTAEDIATRAAELANELILDPHKLLLGVCIGITGRSRGEGDHATTPEQLTEAELTAAAEFLDDVAGGRVEVTSFREDGRLNIKRRG